MGGFVNCSNHPSGGWLKAQKDAAEKYGTITDIPFPAVRCNLTDQQMEDLLQREFCRNLHPFRQEEAKYWKWNCCCVDLYRENISYCW